MTPFEMLFYFLLGMLFLATIVVIPEQWDDLQWQRRRRSPLSTEERQMLAKKIFSSNCGDPDCACQRKPLMQAQPNPIRAKAEQSLMNRIMQQPGMRWYSGTHGECEAEWSHYHQDPAT